MLLQFESQPRRWASNPEWLLLELSFQTSGLREGQRAQCCQVHLGVYGCGVWTPMAEHFADLVQRGALPEQVSR